MNIRFLLAFIVILGIFVGLNYYVTRPNRPQMQQSRRNDYTVIIKHDSGQTTKMQCMIQKN